MQAQDPNATRTSTENGGAVGQPSGVRAPASSSGTIRAELSPGTILSHRYQILSTLGHGGMGVVYRARTSDGYEVALKTLQGALGDPESDSYKRFWREARATSTIQHPNVVRLFDAGADEDIPYLVMELLDGKDLASAIQREGPLDPALITRIFIQACRGLAALHAQQIVHRDIKPSNLFLHRDPSGLLVAKLCDLGIAKHDPSSGGHSTELTHTGGLLGSPAYMSPEQVQDSKRVDQRTDLWSLCASLYEALSGRKCWAACTNVGEIFVAICTRDVPPLAGLAPWLDPKLCEVIHRGLRQEREERFSSANELAAALEPFAAPDAALSSARIDFLANTLAMTDAQRTGGPTDRASAAASGVATAAAPRPKIGRIVAVSMLSLAGVAAVAFLGVRYVSGKQDATAGARNVAAGGLELGSHGCMMIDGTGSYNRVCTVEQEGGGPLKVRAKGTSLNPNISFEFTATGGPNSYEASGQMRAFDGCTGPFSASTEVQSSAAGTWYILKFKHCKLMIRKERL